MFMNSVAVILPTYKPGEYFLDCLNSIEMQTLNKQFFCVYIALNGPKGDFENFVKRSLEQFTFNYKYYYIAAPGVSLARNKLIDNSVEDYLVFLDDDDEMSPNYLDNLLLVTNPMTMGITNVINFSEKRDNKLKSYIGDSFLKLESNGTSLFRYRKYFSSPWAKMLHRDMLKNTHFDTRLARGEDTLFMTIISKNIAHISKCSDDTIYYVNVRQNSSSRKKVDKKAELKRLLYLCGQYFSYLFNQRYDRFFILTRIAATIKHFKKLL